MSGQKPQGGILSPIIFIIYGADMEEWVKESCIFNYADDTKSSCKDKDEQVVMRKLEEDATNILEFMASNGLVANPTKTVFMMLNNKKIGPEKLQWETIKSKNQNQQNFLVCR